MPTTRLPDFLIIGFAKCGSTSLFQWLGQHPDVSLPHDKEPNFLVDDERWARGIPWYGGLFPPDARCTGEASVRYCAPGESEIAAERAELTLPNARLICLLRDPIERLRSQYRHEVQRGREKRDIVEAVSAPGSRYVEGSRYFQCLRPWIERCGPDRLLVVQHADLVGDRHPAWPVILSHLGLSSMPCPGEVHNASGSKRQFRAVTRLTYDRGWSEWFKKVPKPLRVAARPLLLRSSADTVVTEQRSEEELPERVHETLRADAERLRTALGWDDVPWNI